MITPLNLLRPTPVPNRHLTPPAAARAGRTIGEIVHEIFQHIGRVFNSLFTKSTPNGETHEEFPSALAEKNALVDPSEPPPVNDSYEAENEREIQKLKEDLVQKMDRPLEQRSASGDLPLGKRISLDEPKDKRSLWFRPKYNRDWVEKKPEIETSEEWDSLIYPSFCGSQPF